MAQRGDKGSTRPLSRGTKKTAATNRNGARDTAASGFDIVDDRQGGYDYLDETAQSRDVGVYKKVDPIEHVRRRPNMYVGNTNRVPTKCYQMIPEESAAAGKRNIAPIYRAVLAPTDMPEAMRHLLQELLSNVGDNCDASIAAGVNPGECYVDVEGGRITVTNNGLGIPLEISPQTGRYLPEMIFGDLMSGTNLEEDRASGGANGIGAKAAGILSTEFTVDICNPLFGTRYIQTWTDNFRSRTEPEWYDYDGDINIISISYTIDAARFGYPEPNFVYDETALQIFHWMAASLSFTANIPVSFNGLRQHYKLKNYAALYFDISGETPVHNFVLQDSWIQAVVLDAPGHGGHVAFANHIYNPQGGLHVKAPLTAMKNQVITALSGTAGGSKGKKDKYPVGAPVYDAPPDGNNKALVARGGRGAAGATGKGAGTAATTGKAAVPKGPKVTVSNIKPNVFVVISITSIEQPVWGGGQSKTSYLGPDFSVALPEKAEQEIKNWNLIKYLKNNNSAKALAEISKIDPSERRGRHIFTTRGVDANILGLDSELHVVEGKSAEGYDSQLLDFIPGGRRNVGTQTLRGKLINVLKASDDKILKNAEVRELIRRIGLTFETDYKDPKNLKKLRYGRLVIMTDADIDGIHIKCLILAFFERYFPSLLEIGYVVDYMTPCMRAYHRRRKNAEPLKFYYDAQYELWKANTPDHADYEIRYFKGLGTSEPHDIKNDWQTYQLINLSYDEDSSALLRWSMSDGEDKTAWRKQWMAEWDMSLVRPIVNKQMPISQLVDDHFRYYAVSVLARSMVGWDGMTEVVRKIIFSAFKHWGTHGGNGKKELTIPELQGITSGLTNYHHGNDSMCGAITVLGQSFTGSNNIPLLQGAGNFGTLEAGGKHAAQPRYLKVKLSPIAYLLINPKDFPLVPMAVSDGVTVEPEFYLTTIPLSLINGISSVAMGCSSYCPNHHPLEVIDAFLDRLDEIPFRTLTPWYRGFQGEIYLDEQGAFVSRGVLEWAQGNDYIISTLPVGIWNNKYLKWLQSKVLTGEIDDFETDCTATRTWFHVKGYHVFDENGQPRDLTEEDIGISRRRVLNNIQILTDYNKPQLFANTAEFMEGSYQYRLPWFQKRKDHILNTLRDELSVIAERMAYIQACITGQLKFREGKKPRKRVDILANIERLKLRVEFYTGTNGYKIVHDKQRDEEGLNKLKDKYSKVEEEINQLEATSIHDLWRQDLMALREGYLKQYTADTPS